MGDERNQKAMSYDYQKFYDALGDSGIAPYVVDVPITTTFRLVTGTESIDPSRGSGPGRSEDASRFHIYTSDQILVCSGEVVGSGQIAQPAVIGQYQISGHYVDYDKIQVTGFQDLWRSTTGEAKYEFSQGFTNFLVAGRYLPSGVVGSVWTSLSGQALGIPGRCFSTNVTGAPYCVYLGSYSP